MRLLSEHERIALIKVDFYDGRCVPDYVFTELIKLRYGYWSPNDDDEIVWWVTPKGRFALHLDTIAKRI